MDYEEEDFVYDWTSGYIKVVWNFQRYPLPDVADIPLIYGNIDSVLEEKHHFTGYMETMAYGLQPDQYEPYGCNKTIYCEYFPDDTTMTMDILHRFRFNFDSPSRKMNIALIAKENEVDRELLRILKGLASRNHTVWFVEPPEEGRPFDFSNAQVLEGGSRPQSISSASSDHFIEDFSLPLLPISGHNVGIFWDAKDCPFPDEVRDPDLMYEKIVTGLEDRGFEGKMSIWAYVDETEEYWKDKLVNKTWKASIYFLPRGDGRMFHDVILWIKDTPVTLGPYGWSLVILKEPRTCDKPVFDWLRGYNDLSRRQHPDLYCVFKMKLSLLIESESESESEREGEQGSPKRAKVCVTYIYG